jgi:tetratricopeptide (TPR) repeat protein
MPAPERPSARPTPPRPTSDAVERLYVYWLVSTALLLVVVLIVGILLRGALHQQATAIIDLSERVAALETNAPSAPAAPARRPIEPREPAAGQPAPPAGAPASAPAPRLPSGATQPAASRPPATMSQPAVLSEDAVHAALDEITGAEPITPADVARPDEGLAILDNALQNAARSHWSGATWARLAVLARLLGRDATAQALAERARAGADPLIAYDEVTIRELLARGPAQEALPIATRLVEHTAGAPTASVLLAATLLATDNPASADEVLDNVHMPVVLDTYDKLLLARALFTLEHWQRLDALLSTLREVPASLNREYSFLTAVSLARSGRTVEALAILDGLIPTARRSRETTTTPATTSTVPSWPMPGPDRYELEVWRGVTLMYAQQPEAARQVLQQAAESDPGRPDAQYYLGLLEARAGRPQIALVHFKNALASSARMAPAWEALALLEIDSGQINLALEHLGKAIAINPRRAAAHFLTAIAQAKLSHAQQAAESLRRAFQLDDRVLSEAKHTDVLLRLFTPEDMDRLAAGPTTGPAESQPLDQK